MNGENRMVLALGCLTRGQVTGGMPAMLAATRLDCLLFRQMNPYTQINHINKG
jgi:hypothetical protein